MKEFLNDKHFLDQLTDLRLKDLYVRLTILSWSEEPIKEIQGKVTSSGSLSLDGTSSLRRTGSLTMFADEKNNNLEGIDNDISINKKVKIELGLLNKVPTEIIQIATAGNLEIRSIDYKEKYGDVIWFPLGVYVLFDPSLTHSESGVEISISFKDKMCLLNGDAGGVIPAAVTFSELEYLDENGNIVIENVTLYQIITELVNHFGAEDLAKIIITDLPTTAKQAMCYIGTGDLYYVPASSTSINFFTDYNRARAASKDGQVITYESYDDIGFIMTDFIYPGELTCNPGDTITSVLDNIISVLGNYEYFYDVEGVFHFQEIKNYLNTSYTTDILNKLNTSPDYQVDFSIGESVYTFEGTKHITNMSNNPSYSNVKNDFLVWGKRTTSDGYELPIRYHLAIDTRPKVQGYRNGKAYYGIHDNVILYYDEDDLLKARIGEGGKTVYTLDYREELYYQGLEAEATGTNYNYYFTELYAEWPKIFDLEHQCFYEIYINDPSQMDYYLDIIDSSSAIGQYSVANIGRRSMVVQEDGINCIFEQDIPDLVFINTDDYTSEELQRLKDKYNAMGQKWYQIDNIFNSLLVAGGVLNSAYYRMAELLYQYTNMNNAISFSTLPLYNLEPNTRITVHDDSIGVYGDYVITSISLPIGIENMTMDISAYKCLQKI